MLAILYLQLPLLLMFAHNSASLRFQDNLHLFGWACVAGLAILTLGVLFRRVQYRLYASVSICYFLFFCYGHLKALNAVEINYLYRGILATTWTICTLVVGLLFVYKRTEVEARQVTRYLSIVGIMLSVHPVFAILSNSATPITDIPETSLSENAPQVSSSTPDVYYIILDGYARADTLRELYDFDNSDMMSYLTQKNFYVATGSISNYSQTTLSLASSLNMQYLQTGLPLPPTETRRDLALHYLSENAVSKLFKQLGYTYVVYTSGYWWTRVTSADRFVSPSGSLSEFEQAILNMTPVPDLLEEYSHKSLYDVRRNQLDFVFDTIPLEARDPEPTFVFAHIVAPHPPFVFGRDGEALDSEGLPFSFWDANWYLKLGGTTKGYLRKYADQLAYINKRTMQMVDSIIASSVTPPIIILQADHGPGSEVNFDDHTLTNFSERHAILNTYHFPGPSTQKQLYPGISPVNTFRVLFNTYFGATFPLLEDRAYFSTYGHMYDYHDVSDEVHATEVGV